MSTWVLYLLLTIAQKEIGDFTAKYYQIQKLKTSNKLLLIKL